MCWLTENVNDNKQTTNCADDVTERETLIALDSGLSLHFCLHTGWAKKVSQKLTTITLSNFNGFSKFFQHSKENYRKLSKNLCLLNLLSIKYSMCDVSMTSKYQKNHGAPGWYLFTSHLSLVRILRATDGWPGWVNLPGVLACVCMFLYILL